MCQSRKQCVQMAGHGCTKIPFGRDDGDLDTEKTRSTNKQRYLGIGMATCISLIVGNLSNRLKQGSKSDYIRICEYRKKAMDERENKKLPVHTRLPCVEITNGYTFFAQTHVLLTQQPPIQYERDSFPICCGAVNREQRVKQ